MRDRRAASLPAEVTSFVGRRRDLAAIAELVGEHRLVTLVGPGGVGKTRLATRVGSELLDRFPDGVWFTDLSLTNRPELVPALVAEPFDVGDVSTVRPRPLAQVLADYFAERRLLLILDNCEHVTPAVAELVGSLRAACPDLAVLATSRRTLDLPGEVIYRVAPLGTASEAGATVLPEAVELFLDRLRLVDASRQPDADEMAAIEAIVARLDGLPLAIELAASRTKLLPPAEILERLSDFFGLLTGGRGRPRRQETLLATMEWSHDLLDEPERAALARLAVFSGWTLEAASAILGADANALVERLLDSSLVEVDARGPTARYRMLETVRQYGLRRLDETGGLEPARRAHALHFLELAERSDRALRSSEQARWLGIMRPEHDNVRAALGWAIEVGDADLALRLVAASGRFWFMQTHWAEALDWLARAAAIAGADDDAAWARAFIRTGVIELITQGSPSDPSSARRARDILREHGTPSELAMATYAVAETEADPELVRTLMDESLRLMGEAGDRWGAAYVKRWQGGKVELVGDPLASAAYQREAVEELTRLGDRWTAAWLAFDLAFSLLAGERYDEARAAVEDSFRLVEGIDDRLVVAHATRGQAAVAAGVGRHEEARRDYLAAIPMLERIGDVNCLAFSRMFLSEVETALDATIDAGQRLHAALEGFRSIHHEAGMAAAARRLARHLALTGDAGAGARMLGAALAIRGGAPAELAPREQVLYAQVREMLASELGEAESERLVADGRATPFEQVAATAGRRRSQPAAGAPDGPRGGRTGWPRDHLALLARLTSDWGVRDDIRIHRGLGGTSGADVLAVDITTDAFSGQAILKLQRHERTGEADLEAERHALAFERAPAFAERRIPRLVQRGRWGASSALLAAIASRGLEYTVPWAEAAYATQARVGAQVAGDLLADWNRDYRLAPDIVSPSGLLAAWLAHRLDPARGRLHGLLEERGVDPLAGTLIHDGAWYPNPLAFATAPDQPERLGLRPVVGHTHGDLHGFNLLVRDVDGSLDWFLIDLASYDPARPLFLDHAYLELAHLLESRAGAPLAGWQPLIAALDGEASVRADDVGLVELLRSLRGAARAWIEAVEPDRLAPLEAQRMLARVAVGLDFANKRIPSPLRHRGLLYAMASLKRYVAFAGLEWYRTGPLLRLPDP